MHCYLNNMSKRTYTSSAISKKWDYLTCAIQGQAMYGYVKNRYIDRYHRPPGNSRVRQSFLLPWYFLPVMRPAIRLPERVSRE